MLSCVCVCMCGARLVYQQSATTTSVSSALKPLTLCRTLSVGAAELQAHMLSSADLAMRLRCVVHCGISELFTRAGRCLHGPPATGPTLGWRWLVF